MEIEGYIFPDDLYYHKEHFWAKVEGNIVTIGTNDLLKNSQAKLSMSNYHLRVDPLSKVNLVVP